MRNSSGHNGTGTDGPGANPKYFIDVESNGAPNGTQYSIFCQSGSGHSSYELVGRNLPDLY